MCKHINEEVPQVKWIALKDVVHHQEIRPNHDPYCIKPTTNAPCKEHVDVLMGWFWHLGGFLGLGYGEGLPK